VKSVISTMTRIAALAVILAVGAVLSSCSPSASEPAEQPDLSAFAQPYAEQLVAQGVLRIDAPGAGGSYIRVKTRYGTFEIRDQGDAAPAPFVVASDTSLRVLADAYEPSDLPKYRAAIDRVVPAVLRVAPSKEAALQQLQPALD